MRSRTKRGIIKISKKLLTSIFWLDIIITDTINADKNSLKFYILLESGII